MVDEWADLCRWNPGDKVAGTESGARRVLVLVTGLRAVRMVPKVLDGRQGRENP